MGLLASGYTIITCHPPFPAVVVAFFLLGFDIALSIALNNAFCTNIPYSTIALGCFTGAYGIGGVISPLKATAMASRGILWSHFYAISLGISLVNLGLSAWAFFQFKETRNINSRQIGADGTASPSTHNDEPMSRAHILRTAIQSRTTLFGSLFIFAYQGAELSVSGWVVSLLIQ